MDTAQLVELITKRRKELKLTEAELSRAVAGHGTVVTDLRRGRTPSVWRLKRICEALGLELYIGPPRGGRGPETVNVTPKGAPQVGPPLSVLEHHTQGLVRAVVAAGGDPIPMEIRDELVAAELEAARVRENATNTDSGGDECVQIPLLPDVSLAAGVGEPLTGEADEVPVSVRLRELAPWARPHVNRLHCVRVVGDSMSPTIHDGDLVATDPGHRKPLDGELFALWTDTGLIIKRLHGSGAGRWQLASDNPAYAPRPAAEGDCILGRVAWTGPPPPTEG